jgi:SAM-dependent methyltransferase
MTAEGPRPSHTDRFNRSHAARLQSITLERLWRTAFGEDYPAEAKPNAFFSLTTLQHLVGALHLGPGHMLVDLGCGHGGPGLWVAQQVGANLIGIDLSAVGVALAQDRATVLGLGKRVRFKEGDLTATGLPEASCDAAMSLDVLLFVPDKPAAMREVARILRPGGRFGFTTWEQPGYSDRLGAPQLVDHRPLLVETGFNVETYEEPSNWQHQQRVLLEGIIASGSELGKEIDGAVAASYVAMAHGMLADMLSRRYVLVVARRR